MLNTKFLNNKIFVVANTYLPLLFLILSLLSSIIFFIPGLYNTDLANIISSLLYSFLSGGTWLIAGQMTALSVITYAFLGDKKPFYMGIAMIIIGLISNIATGPFSTDSEWLDYYSILSALFTIMLVTLPIIFYIYIIGVFKKFKQIKPIG